MSAALAQLAAQCAACRRCAHGSTRIQIVFAKGDPLSPLCFVGEAPGEEEDAQGVPFVGDSGKLLDKQIAAMREYAAAQGIAFPADPYVRNVLKCQPPGNKLLKDGSDIAACSEHLWAQLRALPNLRVIVALGQTAAQTLLGVSVTGCHWVSLSEWLPIPASSRRARRSGRRARRLADARRRRAGIQITALRVRMHRSQSGGFNFLRMVQQPQRSAIIITTYHPAYLLRQPNNKELSRAVWADLKRAVEALR